MSTALTALTSRLAAKLNMGDDGSSLIQTLKATAFKGDVSDAQMTALLVVANQYGLNPWTKEIYAFPDKKNGIVPVVGVDGWARIINEHPQFDGMEFEQSDDMVRMPGANCDAPAWVECSMYRKDRSRPVAIREYLDEAYREPFKGQYGPVLGPWQSHPKRFLRHKAMIQCARIAFGYGGIYDSDEAERIVERDMGAADVVSTRPAQQAVPPAAPAALPDYSQDAFDANFAKWSAAIVSGMLTADEVIRRASTKGTLSAEQRAAIHAAAQPAPDPDVIDAPADAAADSDGWLKDYDQGAAQ